MNVINIIMYLFYRYYYASRYYRSIAYFSAKLALLLIIYINITSLSAILHIDMFLVSVYDDSIVTLFLVFLYILIIYLILNKVLDKEKIINLEVAPKYRRLYSYLLVVYIIVSFSFLVYAAIEFRGWNE